MNTRKKSSRLFPLIKKTIDFFYTEPKIVGLENLPEDPAVIVANHCQIHGPIVSELYFPGEHYTWCNGEMMDVKTVPAYSYKDFWSYKPKCTKPFYKLLSYIIAPIASLIFNSANTIPVHRDIHVMSTFKESIAKLSSGCNLVIFPEHDLEYNNIIYDFQSVFIDMAKLYHKKHGVELSFVPMYIAPNLHMAVIGKAVKFNSNAPIDEERNRIKNYLMGEITSIGRELPRHKVVPYRNLSKKDHPWNREADL